MIIWAHGCHRSGKSQGKTNSFKAREKSGNFTLSQGIFEKRQRKVRLFIWTLSPLSDERWWHFPFYDVYVTCVHCLVELTDSWPVYLYSSSSRFMNEMMFIFPFIFYSLFLFNFFDTIMGIERHCNGNKGLEIDNNDKWNENNTQQHCPFHDQAMSSEWFCKPFKQFIHQSG